MRYAIEKDGYTLNVILADESAVAGLIAAQQGATARALVDGESPSLPVFEPPPVPMLEVSKSEFLRRFTADERVAFRASGDPFVEDFLALLDLAPTVRLDDPETIAGVTRLGALGLLGAGRVAAVLIT